MLAISADEGKKPGGWMNKRGSSHQDQPAPKNADGYGYAEALQTYAEQRLSQRQ